MSERTKPGDPAVPSPPGRGHRRPERRHRERRLAVARIVGGTALALVASTAIELPEELYRRFQGLASPHTVYVVAALFALAAVVAGLVRERPWSVIAAPVLLSLNIGIFVPALVRDPVLAAVVVVWNLVLLAQIALPSPRRRRLDRPEADSLEAWLAQTAPATIHLATVAIFLIVSVVGYRLASDPLAFAICFLLGWATAAAAWRFLRLTIAAGARLPWLVVGGVAASLLLLPWPALALSVLALPLVVLLGLLVTRTRTGEELLQSFFNNPPRLVFASFALLVLLGTVLLTFPVASATDRPIATLDALFTAVSATCVTGLIVLDTPTAFSPVGHAIVLGLIQAGGLGILVLSTFGTLALGGTLGLRGERALSESLELRSGRAALRLTRFIVLSTLAVEAAGALVLTGVYLVDRGESVGKALWLGVFHAVSAFCNAGFSLHSDSLVGFQGNPLVLATIGALITLGGLGFPVLAGLWQRLVSRQRVQLNLHAQVVLRASAVLVLVGMVAIALLEWRGALAGLSVFDKVSNALFQSVTLRTAGFNSIGFEHLAPATVLVMILWMFIGASPGSTGGGIKTTTAAVVLAAISSELRGAAGVRMLDREIPRETMHRSLALLVVSAIIVLSTLLLLLVFEPLPFEMLAFETVSAFGTVGLSTGATFQLGSLGKMVIIAAMFAGRVGPLTFVLVLARGSRQKELVRRPLARITVG